MGDITCSDFTDYSTPCGDMPQSLIKMLANCIYEYDGHYFLNMVGCADECDDLESFWTCDNNGIEPERALVENIFALDECGNMAVKIFFNMGSWDE